MQGSSLAFRISCSCLPPIDPCTPRQQLQGLPGSFPEQPCHPAAGIRTPFLELFWNRRGTWRFWGTIISC